jgi:hypothetical protein
MPKYSDYNNFRKEGNDPLFFEHQWGIMEEKELAKNSIAEWMDERKDIVVKWAIIGGKCRK